MTPEQARAAYEALPKKVQIVALLTGKGFTAREVAELVNRSEATVKGQLIAAYRRLGVNKKNELTSLLVTAGAIVPEEEAA